MYAVYMAYTVHIFIYLCRKNRRFAVAAAAKTDHHHTCKIEINNDNSSSSSNNTKSNHISDIGGAQHKPYSIRTTRAKETKKIIIEAKNKYARLEK